MKYSICNIHLLPKAADLRKEAFDEFPLNMAILLRLLSRNALITFLGWLPVHSSFPGSLYRIACLDCHASFWEKQVSYRVEWLHPGNNGCLLQNYDCYKHDCLPVPVGAETARCIEVTTLLFRLDGYMYGSLKQVISRGHYKSRWVLGEIWASLSQRHNKSHRVLVEISLILTRSLSFRWDLVAISET